MHLGAAAPYGRLHLLNLLIPSLDQDHGLRAQTASERPRLLTNSLAAALPPPLLVSLPPPRSCEGSCLLLRRSESSGNGGTWGLPGGNADAADAGDLLGTALREAREELGELPQGLQVLGQVLTR